MLKDHVMLTQCFVYEYSKQKREKTEGDMRGNIFLPSGGGNLRSDFDHLNLYQREKV